MFHIDGGYSMGEIVRSKRKSRCLRCVGLIKSKYKVEECGNGYSHLSCYYKYLINRIKNLKNQKKMFSKKKYLRILILEGIEK